MPFAIPHDKPTRRERVSYYSAVAELYQVPLALFEDVISVTAGRRWFRGQDAVGIRARLHATVATLLSATGDFHGPRFLGVRVRIRTGWRHRYLEPYGHFRRACGGHWGR